MFCLSVQMGKGDLSCMLLVVLAALRACPEGQAVTTDLCAAPSLVISPLLMPVTFLARTVLDIEASIIGGVASVLLALGLKNEVTTAAATT